MGAMGLLRMHGMRSEVQVLEERIVELEGRLAVAKEETLEATLRANASEKVRQGANLLRAEVAAYIGVSTRKIHRMEAAGSFTRCPKMGSVVRYAARDVLRLVSAMGKER